LPPIPQHHYDEAARQIQQSRHAPAAASATAADDIKMESVVLVLCVFKLNFADELQGNKFTATLKAHESNLSLSQDAR